ncbi:T9SS type A sorting domain-containing protein [Brumimicrobium glaciale]|uniref:T9SS type A sorting domain-containing protein n=1 Tax=Brumimicrobium glaciale TaxID=200475 RepID=A0A4Q4KLM7_9FLAO|nr:T9SS type A sorting domain-containing protein [Brumimicrobium glaciale]RYM33274.1 T9SS type A sorting domain-containing protein [Brumimicrobium glaciale]
MFSQEEKGLTVRYNFTYGNGDYSTRLSSHELKYGDNMDTFEIQIIENKPVILNWEYLNEVGVFGGRFYDSVQWIYNDGLMNVQYYDFQILESHYHHVSSTINDAQPGYYQLRYIFDNDKIYNTNYPVIHVLEKEKDTIILKSSTEITLYPNPTSNIITLKLSQSIKSGEMKVYSLKGNLELSYPLIDVALNSKYDVSRLSSGIYIFSIIDNENGGEIKRMKVVIE